MLAAGSAWAGADASTVAIATKATPQCRLKLAVRVTVPFEALAVGIEQTRFLFRRVLNGVSWLMKVYKCVNDCKESDRQFRFCIIWPYGLVPLSPNK